MNRDFGGVMMFKLCQEPQGVGLSCDQQGLFLAGVPLLERDGLGRFQPRPSTAVRKILSDAYWDRGGLGKLH